VFVSLLSANFHETSHLVSSKNVQTEAKITLFITESDWARAEFEDIAEHRASKVNDFDKGLRQVDFSSLDP
jgi:hypothetical protein